jgi:hypothetical protein
MDKGSQRMQRPLATLQTVINPQNDLGQNNCFGLNFFVVIDFFRAHNEHPLFAFIRWAQRFFRERVRLAFIMLLTILSIVACAQDRDDEDEDEATQTEAQDKEAAKRSRKAERKSRKDKKDSKASSKAIDLPPAPDTPPEFEFFDGAIFSRKANLGIKGVLCFASERRPLAMLWKEAGQADARGEGGATSGGAPMKLTPRELQLIFGRPVDAAQVSVLDEKGHMLSRGASAQVAFNLGRKPVYLLVEASASRPPASAISNDEDFSAFHDNLAEVRVYPDPKRAKGPRTVAFANLTRQVTIQILANEKIVFEIVDPGAPIWKWDGYDQSRQPLPDGKYPYRILAKGGSASGVVDLKSN